MTTAAYLGGKAGGGSVVPVDVLLVTVDVVVTPWMEVFTTTARGALRLRATTSEMRPLRMRVE